MIDFYHLDSMDTINFESIYRRLDDAHMIACPEIKWLDFERARQYFQKKNIPFLTKPNISPECVIQTQYPINLEKVPQYKDSLKVRLMYSLAEKNFAHNPKACRGFDLVLVPGRFSYQRVCRFAPTKIVGFTKYDDFFAGKIKKPEALAELGLKSSKPILLYLPTWAQHSSLDLYWQAISELANEYQIILKPHTCTARFEKERIERFRPLIEEGKVKYIEEQMNLDCLFAVADAVVADGISGASWESALIAKLPTVAINMNGDFSKAEHELELPSVLVVNSELHKLRSDIDLARNINEKFADIRDDFADRFIANRDGSAGRRAAEEIQELIATNQAAKAIGAKQKVRITKKSRSVYWFLLDGLRPDKLNCCGNKERPRLFIDEILSKGVLFSNVYSAGGGTHSAMHATFSAMYPSINGAAGWTTEALRRFDPNIFTITDHLKLAGYNTFRYCDAKGERAVPMSGFDVWESSGYTIGKILPNTDYMECEVRRKFIQKVNDCPAPKFAYMHIELLHDLNCKSGPVWPSSSYEHNIEILSQKFQELIAQFKIEKEDLLIISTDHGTVLDKPYAQYERDTGPRQEEISNVTFASMSCEDLQPAYLDRLVRAIDIAPTIMDILGFDPMPGQGASLTPYIFDDEYQENIALREKGTYYDHPSPDASNTWCARDSRWKYAFHKFRKECEWFMDLANDGDYVNNLVELPSTKKEALRKAIVETLIENPKKPLEIYRQQGFAKTKKAIEPTISMILPIEEISDRLETCIESLLDQSGPYHELIILDAISSETMSSLYYGKYLNHPRVRYLCTGASSTEKLLDIGLRVARGKYVAIAHPCAEYEEYFVQALYQELVANPTSRFAVGQCVYKSISNPDVSAVTDYKSSYQVCSLYRIEYLRGVGLFNDLDGKIISLDTINQIKRISFVPEVLSVFYGA